MSFDLKQSHFRQLADALISEFARSGYKMTRLVRKRAFVWSNGTYRGWAHVTGVSGYPDSISRLAICHYNFDDATNRRIKRSHDGICGGLAKKVEISMLRDELFHISTTQWLPKYLAARHAESELPELPFEMSAQHSHDDDPGYWWSREASRLVTRIEIGRDRKRRERAMAGKFAHPDFSEDELQNPRTFMVCV